MIYLWAFVVCGSICLIGQLLYEYTNFTYGHITSLLVISGALLDCFHLYDRLIDLAGMGASIPITSFGHSLIHGALASANTHGLFGILLGMFDLTAIGISSGIVIAFMCAIICQSKG